MFLKILDHSSVVPDLNKLQKITHLTFNYRLGPTYHAMTKVIPARPAPSAQQKLLRSPLSHAYLSLSITLSLYPPFHYLPQNQNGKLHHKQFMEISFSFQWQNGTPEKVFPIVYI